MSEEQKEAALFWLRMKKLDGGVRVRLANGIQVSVPFDELIALVKGATA